MSRFPDVVERLFWEIEAGSIDLEQHQQYVMERVMSRGSLEAMRWLLATYPASAIRAFVEGPGSRRLTPPVLAFWALMSDAEVDIPPGGGRPKWAGA